MTATERNKQSFLAYNSWLGQRGLNKVSFATYTALFTSNEPPAPPAFEAPATPATHAPEAPAAPSPNEMLVDTRAETRPETKVETTYEPIEDPQIPAQAEAKPDTAAHQTGLHLICWLDTIPDAASEELYTKIKKATCVPLSYMTTCAAPSPGEDWQPVATALAAKPALVIWGPCDHLPSEIESLASSIWRMPHPSTFAEPGVKATFWQQLKELMTTVAQHPEI